MSEPSPKHLVAYLDPLSVKAGDTLTVFVTCDVPGEFTASLVQLVSGDDRPHGTGFHEIEIDTSFAGVYPGERQALTPGSYAVLPGLPAGEERTFACYFYPTLLEARQQTLLRNGDFRVCATNEGLAIFCGDTHVDVRAPLREHHWHRLVVSVGKRLDVHVECVPAGPSEQTDRVRSSVPFAAHFANGDCELARESPGCGHFNGRVEAVRIYGIALNIDAALLDLDAARPSNPHLLGAWDFSLAIESTVLVDTSRHTRHGSAHQMPTRAVRGARWRGDVFNWRQDPSQYAAIHFHEDDLVDAQWRPSFRWKVPNDLASSVYAVKLGLGQSEDYAPFFVRPAPHHRRSPVAYLAATATYIAYANQRLGFSGAIFPPRKPQFVNDVYLFDHPEVGSSLYEHHRDGSGVHYSSRLRPVLNLKPKGVPWSFTADCNLTAWLHHLGQPFDVITDEDLHRDGFRALDGYTAVITGTHPEYYSTPMLDGLRDWLGAGGRLMYMGGNGFYWRIAFCPANPAIIEVRRAEDGTRAWMSQPGEYYHSFNGEYGGLWRRVGRPPNALVGVGFAAQGFDGGTYYRFTESSTDPRVSFIVEGLSNQAPFGDHGTQGGGAAGEEIDRFDTSLGSPAHALVIASSEDHRPGMLRVKEEFLMMRPLGDDPEVRADMTFFETPAGGAVFSTGSISYAGALSTNGYDNDVARLTENVLRRFLNPTPFPFPPPSTAPSR